MMIQLDRHDATRLEQARAIVRELGSVLIAYSGGVDSTLLLKLALDELGEHSAAVLASSPAYPESEQQEARVMARSLGARLVEVSTDEVELDAYARNNPDRCFHCKEELFDKLEPIRQQLGLAHLAYGATADDPGAHRPCHRSAAPPGVRFPLLEAGEGKTHSPPSPPWLCLPSSNTPALSPPSSPLPPPTPL